MFLDSLEKMPRRYKRLVFVFFDQVAVVLALLVSSWLRLGDFNLFLSRGNSHAWGFTVLALALVTFAVMSVLELYSSVTRFLAARSIVHFAVASGILAISLVALTFLFDAWIPRSLPFIFFFVVFSFLSAPRVGAALILQNLLGKAGQRIIIFGAGRIAHQIISACNHSTEFVPVALVDDDPSKVGSVINGMRVYHASRLGDLVESTRPQKILVALSNLNSDVRAELAQRLAVFNKQVLFSPPIGKLVEGASLAEGLDSIRIEDLLGRPMAACKPDLMARCITSKRVLVTGAGGSIGSELCRQILEYAPLELVLFEVSEFALYTVLNQLTELCSESGIKSRVTAVLGNVQDRDQVRELFLRTRPHTVYHAAAYKHVPIVEDNISQGLRNNVLGTYHTAQAAIEAHAEHFVLVSTDKAVRPPNVMGATKRLAELVVQSLATTPSRTVLSMVRFGNVLGSSGSVVPLFLRQIRNGGPVTVTHPEVTRYFMSIPEAAQLVIQAGALAKGGDVFALDMGRPVKIVDLVKKMACLLGATVTQEPGLPGILMKYTGLRPGEKLKEEIFLGKNLQATGHPLINCAVEDSISLEQLNRMIETIQNQAPESHVAFHKFVMQYPVEFAVETTAGSPDDAHEGRCGQLAAGLAS